MGKSGVEKIDKTGLVDIRGVQIDTNLPQQQRMTDYVEQIKNPYCFLCGGTGVRIRFDPTGDALKSKLKSYFISIKKA